MTKLLSSIRHLTAISSTKAAALCVSLGVAALLCLTVYPIPAHAAFKIVGMTDEQTQSILQDASSSSDEASLGDPVTADQIADGDYDVQVTSSSSMFNIVAAQLHVSDGSMTCTMTLSGTGYEKLYMGTAEAAQSASDDEYIYYVEDSSGAYTYTVPIDALNTPTDCAAYSIRRQRWYDRTLVFLSDGIEGIQQGADATSSQATDSDSDTGDSGAEADVTYSVNVELTGGSGKATVSSPAQIVDKDGQMTATIVWSSPYYDLMVVDGVEYLPINTSGNSTFEIPVAALDTDIAVSAETTAMSEPHMIDYTLRFSLADKSEGADGTGSNANDNSAETVGGPTESLDAGAQSVADRDTTLGIGWIPVSTLDLSYATHFAVDQYEGGYQLFTIASGDQYLLVPDGAQAPDGISSDIHILHAPLNNMYLVASSALCLFDALDAVDTVSVLGFNTDECSVQAFVDALTDGSITYGGKYGAPDYEILLAHGCTLAIESTMINHTPDVYQQLENLGITVLTDMSSYESSPLGRLEWIKFYGALLGKQDQAQQIFDQQVSIVESVTAEEPTGQTVAFFSINSNGSAVTHKPGDYVAQMIEMAGGTYAFNELGDNTSKATTVTLEMEKFYTIAKDADVIIYNSTIEGEISSLDELIAKNPLLADFKAVQNGNVWCTDENMYQQMTSTGDIISDIHEILVDPDNANPTYLYRLS